MRRILFGCATLLLIVVAAQAHDLFLKLDSYFLQPNSKAVVRVLNGTFQKSDGAVARERLAHLSLHGLGLNAASVDSIVWRAEEKTSVMEIQTGDAGTYLVGISTRPREIALKAADFNEYLSHEGIPDTLAARRKNNELGKDVRERYSKHVRAVFQVGDKLSDDYKRPLNYPVEIIPQQNPYSLKVGQTSPVLCLLNGRPLVNQFVTAGWESQDGKLHSINARTDAKGIARFKLAQPGKWFVKLIHMEPINEAGLNYESKWASLTFEVK
ncbi:MAG: DUF4198 domain-containing protein [Pyrinomonadaceae bacterium]